METGRAQKVVQHRQQLLPVAPKLPDPRDILRENENLRGKVNELHQENQRIKSHFGALRLAKGALARSLEVMIAGYGVKNVYQDK